MNISVCKRINNNKRGYVLVNENQCKHIPASPSVALETFEQLAEKVSCYKDEAVVVVGFAETATAIGFGVAKYLGCSYITTTREELYDKDFIYFEESHSHAKAQKLVTNISGYDFNEYDRIIFVEDEVTTGKTILKAVQQLLNKFKDLSFSVASLLNGMSEEDLQVYDKWGIDVFYLEKIDNSKFEDIVKGYKSENDAVYFEQSKDEVVIGNAKYYSPYGFCFPDMRYGLVGVNLYQKNLQKVFDKLEYDIDENYKVLVLGTEEFMYPAIFFGSLLEKKYGCTVKCHSTTRSPILSKHIPNYPLRHTAQLPSVYDLERDTFIYNMTYYDSVFIVTETRAKYIERLVGLCWHYNNTDINVIKLGE